MSPGRSLGARPRLTRALLGPGRELELQTVAEGIERPDQLAQLKELGCTLGQGFLFARPMRAGDMCELLAARRPSAADERDVAPPPAELAQTRLVRQVGAGERAVRGTAR